MYFNDLIIILFPGLFQIPNVLPTIRNTFGLTMTCAYFCLSVNNFSTGNDTPVIEFRDGFR